MKASNVALIFRREVVDQLRDRRTLFMIFVLPIFLYPILGYGMTVVTSAFEQKTRRVAVVGAEFLPEEPPLLSSLAGERPLPDDQLERRFDASLFDAPDDADRVVVRAMPSDDSAGWSRPEVALAALRKGGLDVIVVIPPAIREQIAEVEQPELAIYYDRASEQSRSTYDRVTSILDRWQDRIVAGRLKAEGKKVGYTRPVTIDGKNVAAATGQASAGGSVWARILPFLLVMMALTGAFYPAIDLCAGEKERGTMETLLISPASRGEIVLGKFLTVFLASVATALLNLASMGVMMTMVARQMGVGAMAGGGASGERAAELADLQPPSLAAIGWMLVLLVPLSIFFSSLCLALAVMARSMKEGQYYLTPLYMFALPLIFLTLMPGVELNAFFCLVPITGVALLLKDLLLGQYDQAWTYFLPVMMTTLAYGAMALRWAVDQFQSEDVLFREAERFELTSYLKHLVRDRGATPTTGGAVACFGLILLASWYGSMFLGRVDPLVGTVIIHVAVILGVPLLLTFVLTRSPRRTLLLRAPGWGFAALGVGLAVAINPLSAELRPVIEQLFPINSSVAEALTRIAATIPNLAVALGLFAVMPAITEEVAFRGFILSGLRSGHRTTAAVVLSAVLFGLLHVILSLYQQFFTAAIVGLILGALAVRSRSLLPGVLMHATNNALAVVLPTLASETKPGASWVGWLYRDAARGLYHPWWVALAMVATGALLYALAHLPAAREAGGGEEEGLGLDAVAGGAPPPELA